MYSVIHGIAHFPFFPVKVACMYNGKLSNIRVANPASTHHATGDNTVENSPRVEMEIVQRLDGSN